MEDRRRCSRQGKRQHRRDECAADHRTRDRVATLLLDIGKGIFAVWLAARVTDDSPLWTSAAALAVMAGHAYPIFLKFRGGKAVASFIGAFLYLTPIPLLAVFVLS